MVKQYKKFDKQNGSALILVVVVTVLLAVVGVMFLMVSRASELETHAVIQNKDLNNAVDTVVARINEVLVEDLFGADPNIVDAEDGVNFDADEPYDYPLHNSNLNSTSGLPFNPGPDATDWTDDDEPIPGNLDDFWLSSLEPEWEDYSNADPLDDAYVWRHVTDLWGTLQGRTDSLFTQSFYTLTPPNLWIDPDDDTVPAQWGNGMWGILKVSANNVRAKIVEPKDRMKVVLEQAGPVITDWQDSSKTNLFGARADADGDGVADSRWVQVPGLTSSRGEPVFAAVRIIDNCAMLNLNAAHCFYQGDYDPVSFFEKPWFENSAAAAPYHNNQSTGSGRYLTEINYLSFLRGRDLNGLLFDSGSSGESGDGWYNLILAKGFWDTVAGLPLSPFDCQAVLMNIENPVTGYQFFDIGDELELRNRYLVTSKTEAHFEAKEIGPPINYPGVANYTLDAGGGTYGALRTPVDDPVAFNAWKIKIDSLNFDKWDMFGNLLPGTDPLYRYDRRHVCTFYSYDRMFRRGQYPLLVQELIAAGWTQQQIGDQAIFWPVGPVTTNIAVPFYNTVSGQWETNTNNTETRRRILHFLFAFREYFYQQNGNDLSAAAKSAAQVVANLIDYSDDDALNTLPVRGATEGPFYEDGSVTPYDYGSQANVDCTFITEQIIEDMIDELSGGLIPVGTMAFGLDPDPAVGIVFGYEKQPFISEVFADWDGALGPNAALKAVALEVVNPYSQTLDMEGWALKVGKNTIFTFDNDPTWDVPEINSGRVVYHGIFPGSGSMTISGILSPNISELDMLDTLFYNPAENVETQLLRPTPQWVSVNLGIDYIVVDRISDDDMRLVLGTDGSYSMQRDDNDWKFIQGKYASVASVVLPYELGTENTNAVSGLESFQIGVADDGLGLSRWHELEVLGLYGNGPEGDPNLIQTVSSTLADPNVSPLHFDLAGTSSDLLDYVSTINRPDFGSLPGRININTAPVHVIATAIPPLLADPNGATGLSALDFAQAVVDQRNTVGPFEKLSELLAIGTDPNDVDFQFYANDPNNLYNAGSQSIENDIEEKHWILSNLANKFTVRSDTFTAYILVRLGEEGPQRRMIGIFDRSQVWDKNDRPKLVALHPVPDPR